MPKFARLTILAGLFFFASASAVFAAGTAAGDSVTNGYFSTADTIPQSLLEGARHAYNREHSSQKHSYSSRHRLADGVVRRYSAAG